ncbi:MAG: TetR/AcrR family transcriptional regulator [Deltaproteobacteria bacterium]|nr:TetR/AcrR family transcriptional regulator [Deltaproteobacteria bacterium]
MKSLNKRDEILKAAMEIIAERGFHGAPIAVIAEKAGVGAGTIYRYFENKDVLIIELYREVEGKLLAAIQEGYSAEKPLKERFLHLGTALLRYLIAHPLYFRYIEQYHNSPYGARLRRDKMLKQADNHDLFKELFEQGIVFQELKELPLFVHFALAFGPLIALMRDHILGFAVLDDTLIKQVIEACWDGIKR